MPGSCGQLRATSARPWNQPTVVGEEPVSRNLRSLELPLTEDCGLPRAPARTVSEAEARSKPSGSAAPHANRLLGRGQLGLAVRRVSIAPKRSRSEALRGGASGRPVSVVQGELDGARSGRWASSTPSSARRRSSSRRQGVVSALRGGGLVWVSVRHGSAFVPRRPAPVAAASPPGR